VAVAYSLRFDLTNAKKLVDKRLIYGKLVDESTNSTNLQGGSEVVARV
jgi:hypothetical protein